MFLILILATATGCATSDGWLMPYGDENAHPVAAAYGNETFSVRKPMPHRPENVRPYEFFYKHCSMNGDEAVYSKTAYDCAGPAF